MVDCAKVVIIVPIYKIIMSQFEMISYKQLLHVMDRYEICVVAPSGLKGRLNEFKRIEFFSDEFFLNVKTYNKLMLSLDFYTRFKEYSYMLIYQLDAFVFCDRLLEFCNMGYDYIGAPWLRGAGIRENNRMNYYYVGNGGLSLRNINNTIKLIETQESEISSFISNEDGFFSSRNSDAFRVAPVEIALQFSFETEIRKCYEENNKMIPMGCHAWARYDVNFWRPWIEKFGYKIPECNGNEDEINKKEYSEQYLRQNFWMNDDVHISDVLHNKKIVIWGNGIIGKRMISLLEKNGLCVDLVVDKQKGNNLESVISPCELEYATNTVIVVCAGINNMKEIIQELQKKGMHYSVNCFRYIDVIVDN